MDKKDRIFFQKQKKNGDVLFSALEDAVEGLIYISETDSPVVAFTCGEAGSGSTESILQQLASTNDTAVEVIPFDDFFARLTDIKEWFGERETRRAKKFLELKRLLEENLRDLKVYRLGTVRIEIFAFGIDAGGRLVGIKTSAVET